MGADVLGESPPRGQEDKDGHGDDGYCADRIQEPRRYPRSTGATEKQTQQLLESIADPLRESLERRRLPVQRVVAMHRQDLVETALSQGRISRRRGLLQGGHQREQACPGIVVAGRRARKVSENLRLSLPGTDLEQARGCPRGRRVGGDGVLNRVVGVPDRLSVHR